MSDSEWECLSQWHPEFVLFTTSPRSACFSCAHSFRSTSFQPNLWPSSVPPASSVRFVQVVAAKSYIT